MPKRYSKRTRRPTYRRKGWMSNIGGALAKATTALAIARQIKSLINVEYKRTLTQYTPVISNTPTIQLLTDVAQGVTESTRNGNSIKGSSLNLKVDIVNNPVTPSCYTRMIVLLDKVSNGVAPTANDILDNSSGSGYLLAPYNNENARSRFVILKDHKFILNQASTPNKTLSFYKKLYSHMKYLNNTAGQAGALTGHLYYLMVSDVSANGPGCNIQSTFSFIDN